MLNEFLMQSSTALSISIGFNFCIILFSMAHISFFRTNGLQPGTWHRKRAMLRFVADHREASEFCFSAMHPNRFCFANSFISDFSPADIPEHWFSRNSRGFVMCRVPGISLNMTAVLIIFRTKTNNLFSATSLCFGWGGLHTKSLLSFKSRWALHYNHCSTDHKIWNTVYQWNHQRRLKS
jgi:hypothetical protein